MNRTLNPYLQRFLVIFCMAAPAWSSLPACRTVQPAARLKDAGSLVTASVTVCANFIEDVSGRGLTADAIGAASDPFAELVLTAPDVCPTTLRAVMDRLRAVDTQGCTQASGSGVEVAVVSELAFAKGAPVGVRPVITRRCSGRKMNDLFFSPTGFALDAPLSDAVEVIGFDSKRSLYNYYAVENGKIRFFGDSTDLLKGPDTSVTFQDQPRRCAGCHTSGGLVMKELTVPWANWHGTPVGLEFPGAFDIAAALSDKLGLGSGAQASIDVLPAPNLEDLVEKGNTRWILTKVATLRSKRDLLGLLRPLFCTQEVNFQTSDLGEDDPATDVEVGDNFLFNALLMSAQPDRLILKAAPYHASVAQHQKMLTDGGQPLTDASGAALHDTFVPFIFPLPSDIDRQTIQELVTQGIISADFSAAVLATDLSRPVFSSPRCGLLRYVPNVDWTAPLAQQIAKGFTSAMTADANLSKAGTELLSNLKTNAAAAESRAVAFHNACALRTQNDPRGIVNDFLIVASAIRSQARTLPVVEHVSLMPQDDFNANAAVELDPTTCTLRQ